MHVIQRLYRNVLLPVEVDRRAVTGVLPAMRTLPGFHGYLTADMGGGVLCTLVTFTTRAPAEVIAASTPEVVRKVMGDLMPTLPEIRIGAVLAAERAAGRALHLTLRQYDGCPDAAALHRRIGDGPGAALRALPGFRGHALIDFGTGRVTAVSLFDSESHAAQADALVQALVVARLADLLPQPAAVLSGRVLSDIQA